MILDYGAYAAAVKDLRGLLSLIGRAEFRAYGYAPQLRQYRAVMRSSPTTH